jgi:hypothetical protein
MTSMMEMDTQDASIPLVPKIEGDDSFAVIIEKLQTQVPRSHSTQD